MRTKPFLLLFLLINIISCTTTTNTEDTKQKEPLDYQVVEYSKIDQETLYYTIDYQYPFFKSENEQLSKRLNKLNGQIKSFLDAAEQTYWGEGTQDVIKIVKESEASGRYELMNRFEVLDTANQLISLKFETYCFTLGAHGSTAINTYNFNPETGKTLSFTDVVELLSDANLEKFNGLLLANFKDPYNCFTEVPKVDSKYKKFAIGPNYLIIYFKAYELGPYACGMPEIMISIGELRKAGLWKL